MPEQAEKATFPAAGGARLHWRCWPAEGLPRGVVALVHGIGEHSGRYASLVGPLTARGYTVCGFDHRGHGRSPGRKGHVDRWEDYREDVAAFIGQVRRERAGLPVFLYGHSLGALIALDYVLHHPAGLAGLIVSAAPIRPTGVSKPHLVAAARVLSRLWPVFPLRLGLDAGALSRDESIVRAYVDDPLVHSLVSVRWGTEAMAAVARVKAGMATIRLPALVLHGGADRIHDAEGSLVLFDALPGPDKEVRIYRDGAHEPHNDLCREQVAADVLEWLDERTEAGEHRTA
jgi:alpha-beta hydrolase superfamily lysophospholipase